MMTDLRGQLKKVAVTACSFLFALASVRSFMLAVSSGRCNVLNIGFGVLFLGLAYATFRQYRWALRLAAVGCVMIAVILPIGLFSPFTAGDDMAGGKEPSSVVLTLLWLTPLEALLLGMIWIIDPRKTDA